MKKIDNKIEYYFVDESGDPVFYDKMGNLIVGLDRGSSKILLLGFIMVMDPKKLRQELKKLQDEIKLDDYLKDIPSWQKSCRYFHAKDDCPEIREKVFKLIKTLDFKAQFIVARKIENIFNSKKLNSSENNFYNHLISLLFRNRLHLSTETNIYFAKRGNKDKQETLESAIRSAKESFESKWSYTNKNTIKVFPQQPTDEPCLQIIDYMNWAVQRLFIKGEERYFKFIEEKISMVWDIYDFKKQKSKESCIYSKNNKLEYKKISPL